MGDEARQRVFHKGELTAQEHWGDPALWTEARIGELVWDQIPEPLHPRIERAMFFFLATADRTGRCDCSFKGGEPGLIRMHSPTRLSFPHFGARVSGNGTYTSLGNILVNPHVSLLFVDFIDGARLRINGEARVEDDSPQRAQFPEAECFVTVEIVRAMPSCASYIPRLVPAAGAQP